MRRRFAYSFPALWFILAIVIQVPVFAQDKCLECHQAIGDKNAELFKRDVHFSKGLSCADCHGGNPSKEEMDESMNLKAGFIGVPKGDNISALCAKCHSNASVMVKKYKSSIPLDQMESLKSSVHGQLSISGKERIAQCTSCHGAHGIARKTSRLSSVHPLNLPGTCSKCHSNAAYMRAYDPRVPIDQLEKYRTSVHGKRNVAGDAKTAECASCHGSHEILAAKDVRSHVYATNLPRTCAKCHADAEYMRGYGIPSDQYEKFSKSVHGVALLEKKDLGAPACNDCHGNHGAVPPGVESISKVCGTCHALNADLFSASPHKKAFDKKKLPECETCHGYHDVVATTDDLLGVGEGSVCKWCHGSDMTSKGYNVAKTMRQLVDSLVLEEKEAASMVSEAEQKGMEVGEARFKLREIRQARLETRTQVHSFNGEKFREVAQRGFTSSSKVLDQAKLAIDEYYYRRWGLLVASLIITVLATSLYIYIRRIEKNKSIR